MNIFNKKKYFKYFIILVLLLLLSATAWAAFSDNYTTEDHTIASDLAALSGLTEEQILHIYDLKQDWDVITQDIFIYKCLVLDHFKDGSLSSNDVDLLILDYDANDLLTVCQFLKNESKDLTELSSLMQNYSDGADMSTVLSEAKDEKVYKKYKPASEDEIRLWLSQGYLPEEILKADEIAMAKDILIQNVIKMKTNNNDWDQVETLLSYDEQPVVNEDAELIVSLEGQNEQFSADPYEEATQAVNTEGIEDRQTEEEEIIDQLPISEAEVEQYLNEGFNIYEIKNACQLSKESGVSVDKILSERKNGAEWESIIEKYSTTGGVDAS